MKLARMWFFFSLLLGKKVLFHGEKVLFVENFQLSFISEFACGGCCCSICYLELC